MTREQSTVIPKGYISDSRCLSPAHPLPSSQANILIDREGHACICGFGSLTIFSDNSTPIFSPTQGGSARRMSPELLDPGRVGLERGYPTKESDCYALGMVIYEVLSGRTPFSPFSPPHIIMKVLDGERPRRPQGEEGKWFTDAVWEVLELCWKPQPSDRPDAKTILRRLERVPSPPLLASGVDGVVEASTDNHRQSDDMPNDSRMFSPFCRKFQAHPQSPHGTTAMDTMKVIKIGTPPVRSPI